MVRFRLDLLTRAMLVVALFSISCAEGRIFVVTRTNDTTRITSLRGAIIEANSRGKDHNNTILLGSTESQRKMPGGPRFFLTLLGPGEANSLTGDLNITCPNLTIIGVGEGVTIDATGLHDRVLQVSSNASLRLINITITGGAAPGDDLGYEVDGEPGGAIWNSGKLVMKNCVVKGNSSGRGFFGGSQAPGGGLYNVGVMEIEDCFIAENSSGNASKEAGPGSDGAGIYNAGTAWLKKCTVARNLAGVGGIADLFGDGGSGGNGGGIFNSGAMFLSDCVVSNNFAGDGRQGGLSLETLTFQFGGPGGAGGNGGGICNVGRMVIRSSTVMGNSGGHGGTGGGFPTVAGDGGAGGNGGGIFNAGVLNLINSTVSSNSCGNGGTGGLSHWEGLGNGGEGGDGGGIYNAGSSDLTSCTITLNTAGAGGDGGRSANVGAASSGGSGGHGGGVFNFVTNVATVLIRNTVIAQNLVSLGGRGGVNRDYSDGYSGPWTEEDGIPGSNGANPDLSGDFTSQGFNLVGVADGNSGFTNGFNSDIVGSVAAPIQALLAPLQNNGGITPTHALLPGSLAIDQGNSFGLDTDQRGHGRLFDVASVLNAPGGDGSDIGAFELDSNSTSLQVFTGLRGGPLVAPSGGQFRFQVSASDKELVTIQWSDDLIHWMDIGSVTGTAAFTDTNAATHRIGFYRKRP